MNNTKNMKKEIEIIANKSERLTKKEKAGMAKESLQTIADDYSLRTNPPRVLNVPEASRYVGISERTLRSLIAERKIKIVRLGGRILLRLVDIDRFIEKHLEGGAV